MLAVSGEALVAATQNRPLYPNPESCLSVNSDSSDSGFLKARIFGSQPLTETAMLHSILLLLASLVVSHGNIARFESLFHTPYRPDESRHFLVGTYHVDSMYDKCKELQRAHHVFIQACMSTCACL